METKQQGLKLLHTQTMAGFCSVYLLANIFQDNSYLEYLKNDRFRGCTNEDVNFMLSEKNTGLKIIDVISSIPEIYPELPKMLVYTALKEHDFKTPEGLDWEPVTIHLMSVKRHSEAELWHHVAMIRRNSSLFYIDSYNEREIKVDDYKTFDTLFFKCCVVQSFLLVEANEFPIFKSC